MHLAKLNLFTFWMWGLRYLWIYFILEKKTMNNGPTNEWKFWRSRNFCTRARKEFSLLGWVSPRQPDRRSRNLTFTRAAKTHKPVKNWRSRNSFMALRDPSNKSENSESDSESDLGNRRIRGRSLNSLSYKPSIPRAIANFHWYTVWRWKEFIFPRFVSAAAPRGFAAARV